MTSNATYPKGAYSFKDYWAGINLPDPESPLFGPYVVAYDAAKRAFEAGYASAVHHHDAAMREGTCGGCACQVSLL